MDGLGPVVQFFIHRQPEAQGVRTRQDDLHSHGGEHIGKEGSRVNKVLHQRDLVDEHILESSVKQLLEIPVHHRHIVSPAGFDIGGAAQVLLCHSADGLAEHGRLSGSAQAEDQTDAVALLAVEILFQLLKAITKSPVLYTLRHGLQTPAGNHAGFKIQLGLARFRHAGLQFLQLSLKRLAPINLFLQYLHLSISKILAVLFSVLCPLMVVSDFAVDRLL